MSRVESEKYTLSALCVLFDNRSAAGTPSLAALLSIRSTYDVGHKAEIHAGMNNVFDKAPPIIAGQGGYGNTFPSTCDCG